MNFALILTFSTFSILEKKWINGNASSVEAEEVFDIKCKNFESDPDYYLDITSSRIIYNNCEVGSGKMRLTKDKQFSNPVFEVIKNDKKRR